MRLGLSCNTLTHTYNYSHTLSHTHTHTNRCTGQLLVILCVCVCVYCHIVQAGFVTHLFLKAVWKLGDILGDIRCVEMIPKHLDRKFLNRRCSCTGIKRGKYLQSAQMED